MNNQRFNDFQIATNHLINEILNKEHYKEDFDINFSNNSLFIEFYDDINLTFNINSTSEDLYIPKIVCNSKGISIKFNINNAKNVFIDDINFFSNISFESNDIKNIYFKKLGLIDLTLKDCFNLEKISLEEKYFNIESLDISNTKITNINSKAAISFIKSNNSLIENIYFDKEEQAKNFKTNLQYISFEDNQIIKLKEKDIILSTDNGFIFSKNEDYFYHFFQKKYSHSKNFKKLDIFEEKIALKDYCKITHSNDVIFNILNKTLYSNNIDYKNLNDYNLLNLRAINYCRSIEEADFLIKKGFIVKESDLNKQHFYNFNKELENFLEKNFLINQYKKDSIEFNKKNIIFKI